ncbi:MAG: hypothetical protein LC790_06960, partial [Actinobacteria bacterium]|nr:hypothetical protein [Actinomycetota bacterium]
PYVTPAGAKAAAERRLNWIDLSGNASLSDDDLYGWVQGRANQFSVRGRPSSPFAPRARACLAPAARPRALVATSTDLTDSPPPEPPASRSPSPPRRKSGTMRPPMRKATSTMFCARRAVSGWPPRTKPPHMPELTSSPAGDPRVNGVEGAGATLRASPTRA